MKTKGLISIIGLGVILLFTLGNVNAKKPEHPYYLRALSDLRAARWMINHRTGDWKTTVDEEEAVKRIDEAIHEIKKASIDDGKDIDDHAKVDEHPDHMGRLRNAIEFLKKAREDVNKEEDNGFAQGLRNRALKHIEEAIRLTKRAIHD
jgi:tetratricopeptide (TPR) repeat protein